MSRFGKTTLLDTKLTHDVLSVGRCVFSALQIIAILLLVWREGIWFAVLTLIELFVSSQLCFRNHNGRSTAGEICFEYDTHR